MTMRAFWIVACVFALPHSEGHAGAVGPHDAALPAEPAQGAGAQAGDGPIRIETLRAKGAPPTFVMRGTPKGSALIVFLHGMCGHALGYAQSFQFSAAEKGTLIAPQGDKACGKGQWSSWSNDLDALDARITNAFHEIGRQDPIEDVVVIGYSQGALRAEGLARKWPERYTRLVLMASPSVTSPRGLESIRGTVMMAGGRDRQDLMKASMRAMIAADIPSTFMIIPEATHGSMGPTPEETMGRALDWLWENEKAKAATTASDLTH